MSKLIVFFILVTGVITGFTQPKAPAPAKTDTSAVKPKPEAAPKAEEPAKVKPVANPATPPAAAQPSSAPTATPVAQPASTPAPKPAPVIKESSAVNDPTPRKVKILEDKMKFLEIHKMKELEARLKHLETPPEVTGVEKDLTPLAEGDKSKWGIGQGFGINFGSIADNASMGIEIHLFKVMLPQFERPMTHPGSMGISMGIDTWLNTGLSDNDNFGYSPYLKLTGNSLVFDNYVRIYGSVEPVLVIGYVSSDQVNREDKTETIDNSYFGFRGLFGGEFFASKNYNFFAEVGIMKVNSIDGKTPDTGIVPVLRAGPRFWF